MSAAGAAAPTSGGAQRSGPQSSDWLHQVRAGSVDAPTMVFFPAAGGSASAGWPLGEAIPAGWSLLAVQYPGRGPRMSEAPSDAIRRLALDCLPDLLADAGRTVLFGNSFGAFLAYDVAQLLQAHGAPAAGLVVSGTPPPGIPLPELSKVELGDAALTRLLGRQSGTPPELLVNEELLSMVLPALRHDLSLARCYVDDHGQRLKTPVAAIGGRDDLRVSPDQLAAWRMVTERWLGHRLSDGDHFFFLRDPDALTAVLEQHWGRR